MLPRKEGHDPQELRKRAISSLAFGTTLGKETQTSNKKLLP
jgi:hypothetical protein